MNLVFMGPPGAGKGTQAGIISKKLGIPHISTGAIFRENIEKGTPLGLTAREFMDKGDLVPDEFVLGMVENRLKEEDAHAGFILDGFPRNPAQADVMEGFAPIDKVLFVFIDDEEVVRRNTGRRVCECGAFFNNNVSFLKPNKEGICDKCGRQLIHRSDDHEHIIRNRLEVYHVSMDPVLAFYRAKGLVTDIDGTGTVEEVTKLILKEVI